MRPLSGWIRPAMACIVSDFPAPDSPYSTVTSASLSKRMRRWNSRLASRSRFLDVDGDAHQVCLRRCSKLRGHDQQRDGGDQRNDAPSIPRARRRPPSRLRRSRATTSACGRAGCRRPSASRRIRPSRARTRAARRRGCRATRAATSRGRTLLFRMRRANAPRFRVAHRHRKTTARAARRISGNAAIAAATTAPCHVKIRLTPNQRISHAPINAVVAEHDEQVIAEHRRRQHERQREQRFGDIARERVAPSEQFSERDADDRRENRRQRCDFQREQQRNDRIGRHFRAR